MNYCPYDQFTMEQVIYLGKINYTCGNCGYSRPLQDDETLLFEDRLDSGFAASNISAKDIVDDHVNNRIKIDCSCGSKIGVVYIFGQECRVVLVCENCLTNIDP